ncbi:hypothetical protein L1049_015519 [Liquidambar formosana]|uniref:RING-type domain-containing protein n=1 Tax=Liquidambar formosana TaxID=63359 RepID=A0AAP0X668_LIQFO
MTSASELFQTRRSRVGRTTATTDLGFDSSSDLNTLHHHNRRHHGVFSLNHHRRHDLDGCDLLRRFPPARHLGSRVSLSEHDSIQLDQGTSQYSSGNSINSETSSSMTNRPRSTRSDRLPGAVLLARERLLQRLRGVSLSENRRSGRDPLSIYRNEYTFSNDIRLVDTGHWETEILMGLSAGGTRSTDSTTQIDELPFLQEPSKMKPPGLTQEALDCLPLEVFSSMEKGVEGLVSRASWDCSICLESFVQGEELIHLPCGHRFHYFCLDPWVRTCGDCPYCRRCIVVTSHGDSKRT